MLPRCHTPPTTNQQTSKATPSRPSPCMQPASQKSSCLTPTTCLFSTQPFCLTALSTSCMATCSGKSLLAVVPLMVLRRPECGPDRLSLMSWQPLCCCLILSASHYNLSPPLLLFQAAFDHLKGLVASCTPAWPHVGLRSLASL